MYLPDPECCDVDNFGDFCLDCALQYQEAVRNGELVLNEVDREVDGEDDDTLNVPPPHPFFATSSSSFDAGLLSSKNARGRAYQPPRIDWSRNPNDLNNAKSEQPCGCGGKQQVTEQPPVRNKSKAYQGPPKIDWSKPV